MNIYTFVKQVKIIQGGSGQVTNYINEFNFLNQVIFEFLYIQIKAWDNSGHFTYFEKIYTVQIKNFINKVNIFSQV